jgi:hypothetical protein
VTADAIARFHDIISRFPTHCDAFDGDGECVTPGYPDNNRPVMPLNPPDSSVRAILNRIGR